MAAKNCASEGYTQFPSDIRGIDEVSRSDDNGAGLDEGGLSETSRLHFEEVERWSTGHVCAPGEVWSTGHADIVVLSGDRSYVLPVTFPALALSYPFWLFISNA
jgi:hypothetical protein